METKKLYQTSGGRILLTLKAIWQKFQKNTLWFWLFIIINFVSFTRIDYLFTFNVDDLMVSSQIEKDLFERLLLAGLAFILLIPWGFNQFVRNSKPMIFASLPANLWEKVTALFAYFLIAFVGALVATELTVIIDHLINPELRPLGLNESSKYFLEHALQGQDEMLVFALFSTAILVFISLLTYTSIRFKKAIAGIAVGVAVVVIAFVIFASCMENSSALRDFLKGFEFREMFYLAMSLLTTIEIILIILINRKLKRIEN